MSGNNDPTMSHIGICVADLERSAKFYCDVFGLKRSGHYPAGDDVAKLVGMEPPMEFSSLFLSNGKILIELIAFVRPEAFGASGIRPMNQFGVTHLSFRVGALEPVCERIKAAGGNVLHETKYKFGDGDVIFCTDPDGTRVELMQLPEEFEF